MEPVLHVFHGSPLVGQGKRTAFYRGLPPLASLSLACTVTPLPGLDFLRHPLEKFQGWNAKSFADGINRGDRGVSGPFYDPADIAILQVRKAGKGRLGHLSFLSDIFHCNPKGLKQMRIAFHPVRVQKILTENRYYSIGNPRKRDSETLSGFCNYYIKTYNVVSILFSCC